MRRLMLLLPVVATMPFLSACGGSTRTVTVAKTVTAPTPAAQEKLEYIPVANVPFTHICPAGQGFCVDMPSVPNTTEGEPKPGYTVTDLSKQAHHYEKVWQAELRVSHESAPVYCTDRLNPICGGIQSQSYTESYEVSVERTPWSNHITPDGCSDYPGGHGYTTFRGVPAFFERCPHAITGYFLEHRGLFITIGWAGYHQPPYLKQRFENSFKLD